MKKLETSGFIFIVGVVLVLFTMTQAIFNIKLGILNPKNLIIVAIISFIVSAIFLYIEYKNRR